MCVCVCLFYQVLLVACIHSFLLSLLHLLHSFHFVLIWGEKCERALISIRSDSSFLNEWHFSGVRNGFDVPLRLVRIRKKQHQSQKVVLVHLFSKRWNKTCLIKILCRSSMWPQNTQHPSRPGLHETSEGFYARMGIPGQDSFDVSLWFLRPAQEWKGRCTRR